MEQILQQILKELRDQGERLERLENMISNSVEGEFTAQMRSLYDDRRIIKDTLKRIEDKQHLQNTLLDRQWDEIQILHAKSG